MSRPRFILASASPRRRQLLEQAGIAPDEIIAPDIDESVKKGELVIAYVKRIAAAKAELIAAKHPDAIVLAADTAVSVGRRILPKADTEKDARYCLKLLSGRRHRVYTAVQVIGKGKALQSLAMTQVKFIKLTDADIDAYLKTNEWQGKAGGCAIQGRASAWIPQINGSYSNVVGLPMVETCRMLAAFDITGAE